MNSEMKSDTGHCILCAGSGQNPDRPDEPCPACETVPPVIMPEIKNPYANPKDVQGMKKPPLHLVPASAVMHEAMAFLDGASKYDPYNWRSKKVIASVYVAALKRHVDLWFDESEECAVDSGVHHLGHARACLAILLDAMETGNMLDDRPLKGALSKVIERYKPVINRLIENWKNRLAKES